MLRRQLASDRPFVFNSDLEKSLRNLAELLTTVGRHPEASTVEDEANALSG
ncbi:hypothetical protein FS749_004998 [Ceratobasidium sp. UAMH 11750]|nr:hypothetical protein FS749_004998 [Ceratobasidium sp. UAMH 11750]